MNILKRYKHFVRDVAVLMTGKAGSFAITFAATPIISRLFEPADFGTAAVFTSLVMIIGTFATLRWERAVVLPKEDHNAARLMRLSALALIATAALAWLVALLSATTRLAPPLAGQLGVWIWVLPAALLLLGACQIVEGWLNRKRSYRALAVSDVFQAMGTAGVRIACGAAFGSSVWAQVVGYMLGKVTKLVVLLRGVRRGGGLPAARVTPGELRRVGSEYRDFPLYSAPTALVKSFSDNLPVVMLGLMFSPAVVGFYGMAGRLVRTPLRLAARSLQKVYMQRTAAHAGAGLPLGPTFIKITAGIALLSAIPFTALWFAGRTILVLFLGDKWATAGSYVAILVPWFYSIWVSSPAGALLVVMRRQALWLNIQIGLTIARVLVFGTSHVLSLTAESTLAAFVAVSTLTNFGAVLMTLFLVRNWDRSITVSAPAPAQST